MRKFYLPFTLVVTLLATLCAKAQDFTNKGKDFWVGYGYHEQMNNGAVPGGSQDMVLYFATDVITTVTVTIPGIGYTQTYTNIPANTVFTSNPIPKSGFQDARLTNETSTPQDKGIHIVANHPVVAYAHIYNGSVSGATILYPTTTLGKDYYSVNFKNSSNTTNANCWFYVVATDTGTTTVEVTPSANTTTMTAGNTYTYTLTQGQIFNAMGTYNNSTLSGVDLTGSKIKSISTGTNACKRIAVFSGSGRIAISCVNTAPSSDNYMVQALPKNVWGKKYLTVPCASYTASNTSNPGFTQNIYRVCVLDPATVVSINGGGNPYTLQNGFYYEIPGNANPLMIEGDQPIMVAQYFPSQSNSGCGTVGGDGDPEVIYLSPVEQSINSVQWNACRNFAINQFKNYINVIIPSGGTAISSFKLDGVTVSPTLFFPHPSDPNFSYALINVQGSSSPPGISHKVTSDSGFNAIAYGFGSAESYGYNAGTNVRDLYQFIQISNPYAQVNFPAGCTGTPFYFSMVFPYQPTEIMWDFHSLFLNLTITTPVYDSTWTVNGHQLYRYKIPSPYTIYVPGTYPITVYAQNPTADGCSGEQEINYDLQIFDHPTANFSYSFNGCLSDSVHFFGTPQNTNGRPIINNSWTFGDGGLASIQNPSHKYAAAGAYTVRYSIITDVGCLSDTAQQIINVNQPPVASFAPSPTRCVGQSISFIDQSNNAPGTTLNDWAWDFGDGSAVVHSPNGNPQTHTYNTAGTYTVTLIVTTTTGCASVPYTQQITVMNKPNASFTFGGVCLPNGSTQFTDQSTPAGTITNWSWNFGDGGTGTGPNPVHVYLSTGPFNVTLTITSSAGCMDDSVRIMDQVFAQPHADFTIDNAQGCQGNTFHFTDNSNAPNSSVQNNFWDFGDGNNGTGATATHQYAAPGTYTVRHWVTSAASCMSDTMAKTVTVLQLPTASFTSSTPSCQFSSLIFTSTSVPNAGSITQYSWTVNGLPQGGNTAVLNYTPTTTANLTVTLSVTTNNNCTSQITQTITISPKPVASFTFGGACLPSGATQFNSNSSISDGSQASFVYAWDFGDGGTAAVQNPVHNYASTGPFTVTLTVTSNNGCTDDSIRIMNTVYAQPHADFNINNTTSCLGSAVSFTDISNAPNNTVQNYFWDFGDGNNGSGATPNHTYATAGTYTVRHWVTSAAGCMSDTMSKSVTVVALPTVNFTYSTPICQASNILFTSTSNPNAGTITQYTWTVNGSPAGTNSPTLNYAPPASGNLNVVLSITTSNGCVNQTTQAINVAPKPLASFTFGGACLPSGATQFNSNSSISDGSQASFVYAWDFGDGGTAAVQNPVHNYASTGPFNVTLTITSNNGCADDSIRVMNTVYAQPHADFNINNTTSCLGSAVSFTDNSNAPNNTVQNYFWDFGDGNNGAGATPSHSYATAGTYTVRHWITSAAGCMSDTMSKSVTVVALPTVSFTYSTPICQASNILFTSTSNPNAGTITQYTWTVNGSPAGTNSPTLNYAPPASGNLNVVLSITTSNGCVNQTTQAINVHPKPLASFNFGNACLPTGTMQFTSNSSITDGSQASFTYAWTFGDGGTSAAQNPAHNYTSTGPFSVTLVVTSNNGCLDDSIRSVNTVYAQPTAAFTAPAEVCNGTAVAFVDNSNAPNSSVTQWNWNFGDGGTSTVQSPSHTYASAGTYTVTLTATSAIGCVSTIATRNVVVNPLPTSNFNFSLPNCINQTISFTDASTPNAGNLNNWAWTFGDAGTSGTQNPAHTYATTGTYTVTLQVKTDKGCVSTVVSKPVTISPKPVANFGVPESCLNDPFSQFTDSSTISDGSQAGFTYLWNFGDANASAGNPNTSAVKNPQHQYTAAGPYTVTLTVTSNNGCSNTVSKPFFINGGTPVPMFTVQGGSTSICSGNGITLLDNSSVNPGSVVKLEIYWDYTNDPTIKTVDDDPLAGKAYSHSYPAFGAPATRTVTVRYVAYSGQTCLQYIDQVVTLNATPAITFNAIPGICQDVPSFQITQASVANGLPGSGTFSGPGVSPTGFFDPNAAGSGLKTIRYTYTSSAGCSNFMDQTVDVYPVPVANAGPDKVVLEGGYVVLTPALNTGFPVTYLWTPATGLDNPNSPTPRASPANDITYTLIVTSDKGCSSSDQVFVKQLKAPIIPNIFSPNGDGSHDKWVVAYLDSYPGCTVDIYNRYGQLIYHSLGYTNPWDGKINGKDAPVGTYYYIIDPKNGRSKMTGYVDLIR